MNTDGHGWNRGFWRSKNVHQTMAWLRGPISDLAQLHPCESVSIRGFFCIVPAWSLSENCERCCGEGFWSRARRRGRSIPSKAGCFFFRDQAPQDW